MNSHLNQQPPCGRARRQAGYVLLDVVVAIALASILISAGYQIAGTAAENRRIASTEQGVSLISEALYNYRMQERAWPSAMADLVNYAPNMSANLANGFGMAYTLGPPSPLNDPVAPIRISTELPSEAIAENVAREFHGRATRTGTRVSVEVPIPGHEPARDALLARDGTRDMDGNLDMDRHDLVDVGDVDINGNADVDLVLSATDISARRIITTSNIIVDDALSINDPADPLADSHRVDGHDLQTLNQLNALNCTSNQRVTISAGQASCADLPAPPSTASSLSCAGAKSGDCGCLGDLICGIGGGGTCYCYCANQCGI